MLATLGAVRIPVVVARSLRARRRGIGLVAEGRGVLLVGAAVHTWSPPQPVTAVALDRAGVVVAARRLAPRRVWWRRRAAWILELPARFEAPVPGIRVHLHRFAEPR